MPLGQPSDTTASNAHAPRSDNGHQVFNTDTTANKSKNDHLQHPKPRQALTRHYTSLIEHADQLQVDKPSQKKDGGISRHHDSRRDGFTWGLKTAYDDHDEKRRQSRNPLPPKQHGGKTPPSLEELMRPPENEHADAAHNARVSRTDTDNTTSDIGNMSRSSTQQETVTFRDTRKASMAFFTRGLTRHVPDLRLLPPPRSGHVRGASDSSMDSNGDGKKERKLSFVLPATMEHKGSAELLKRNSNPGDSVSLSLKHLSQRSSVKGSLRDRRNVHLDLSLPVEVPELPPRSRSPVLQYNYNTSSRPRSPKTPLKLNEPPKWSQPASQPTVLIIEEDNVSRVTAGGGHAGFGMFPDNDPISSSHSPKFERPSTKIHNRCYISPPRFSRSRSGQSEHSSDALAHTPDGSWASNDSKEFQEPTVRVAAELEQLTQAAKEARSKRWRWSRSTTHSSDGGPQSPTAEQSVERKFSVNPFRRSNRIAEQTDQDKESKQQQLSPASRLWWIGKQSAPPARPEATRLNPPSHIAIPPTFVPPGVHRVPTPPMLDANGDIKGKLADFFFEHGTDITRRPKPKPSPGGYWDSDALLMSYFSPSINPSEESTEEGPEGPTTPEFAPRGFTCDRNDYGTPPTSMEETWFRRPNNYEETQLTAMALREMDERKKCEWIVPEHLPNSPLCPLHQDYKGYSIGICYWHGRRKSSGGRSKASEEFVGGVYEQGKREKRRKRRAKEGVDRRDGEHGDVKRGARGWQVGMFDQSPEEYREKKRRLQSLSSPR